MACWGTLWRHDLRFVLAAGTNVPAGPQLSAASSEVVGHLHLVALETTAPSGRTPGSASLTNQPMEHHGYSSALFTMP